MIRLKSIGIAIAICSLLLISIINQSDAASITSLSVYTSNDFGGGAYVDASLSADEDIYVIDWYIDNLKIKTTSHYYSPTRSVYENLSTRAGSPFGRTYTIKAVAWFSDAENNTFPSDTDSYSASVYSAPQTGTKTGSWTMAQMSASMDVGWNGRTAEVIGSASVTSYSEEPINYGFNIFYNVVRLTPLGNAAETLWNQPPGLFRGGRLEANPGSSDSAPPYSKSDSFDGSNLLEDHTYLVQAEITATAQPIDGGANIDELNVSDSEELNLSRN